MFPISRDPPEGGTVRKLEDIVTYPEFPISRDPPEGGTPMNHDDWNLVKCSFQFLGIPPKGER